MNDSDNIRNYVNKFDALTELPFCCDYNFKDFYNMYSDAQFILTTRNEDKWLNSTIKYKRMMDIIIDKFPGYGMFTKNFKKSLNKFSMLLSYPSLKKFREKLDPRKYNGATLLGLNGIVVKSHGSADSLGFAAAIDIAYEFAQEEVGKKITKSLSKIQYKMDNLNKLDFKY